MSTEPIHMDRLKNRIAAQGLIDFDVMHFSTQHLILEKKDAMISLRSGEENGYSIRWLAGGRLCLLTGTFADSESLLRAVDSVRATTSLFPSGKHENCLPVDEELPSVRGIFDERLSQHIEGVAGEICDTVETLTERSRARDGLNTHAFLRRSLRTLVNSNGYEASCEDTRITVFITLEKKAAFGSTISLIEARTQRSANMEGLRETVRERIATTLLPTAKVRGTYPVVLVGNATGNFLESILSRVLSVRNDRSLGSRMSSRIGMHVASDCLTIIDDGAVAEGTNSLPFDGDGYSRRRVPLIERGVLLNLLYDAWHAKMDKVTPTGSVSRDGYSSLPVISTTNLQLSPGEGTTASLINDAGNCIVIEEAKFQTDPGNGSTYGQIEFGYEARNGERLSLLSGKYLTLRWPTALMKIEQVSSDHFSRPGWITPSIKLPRGIAWIETGLAEDYPQKVLDNLVLQ